MTVVAYPHIRPQGPGPWVEVELRNITSVFRSPGSNATRTLERPGAAWAFRVSYRNLTRANADRLMAFLSSCRGMAQRFYMPVWSHTRRGSGFGSELFTNGTFADGTTGWTAVNVSLSALDYAIRATLSSAAQASVSQTETFSQHVPYAIRSILHNGRGTSGLSIGRFLTDGTLDVSDYSTSRGLGTLALVPGTSPTLASQYPVVIDATSGLQAGDYLECSFASLARCALVDNGPNDLLQSSSLFTTWSQTNLGAPTANNTDVAPNGATQAETITDDTTNAAHYLSQSFTASSAAHDRTFSVSLKASSLSWAWIQLQENTGSSSIFAYVNLSTGAIGASVGTGANWSNLRTHSVSQGNGWYRFSITGRKTNAATSLSCLIGTSTGDGGGTYAGSGLSIAAWGASCAASSVPVRLTETTTTATSGTSQTGGALHLKGLPASTNGLLLAGDWVQLPGIEQAVRARTALNSDAAGLGYFEFEPFLRDSPADNSPVIVTNPLVRCLLDDNTIRETELADNVVDVEFVAVEDVVPT